MPTVVAIRMPLRAIEGACSNAVLAGGFVVDDGMGEELSKSLTPGPRGAAARPRALVPCHSSALKAHGLELWSLSPQRALKGQRELWPLATALS